MSGSLRAVAFLAIVLSWPASASPLVEGVKGSVRVGIATGSKSPVSAGQRIPIGSTIITGTRSEIVLGFEDGQTIVLDENSEFTIDAYAFSVDQPRNDRFVFELHKGAMRSISGKFTARTPSAYVLRLRHATIGTQGTDFMVALDASAHVSVLKGTVSVKNSAGAAVFGHGMAVTIPPAGAVAPVASAAFPHAVLAQFRRLRKAEVPLAHGTGNPRPVAPETPPLPRS